MTRSIRITGLGGSLGDVSSRLSASRVALEAAREAATSTRLLDIRSLDDDRFGSACLGEPGRSCTEPIGARQVRRDFIVALDIALSGLADNVATSVCEKNSGTWQYDRTSMRGLDQPEDASTSRAIGRDRARLALLGIETGIDEAGARHHERGQSENPQRGAADGASEPCVVTSVCHGSSCGFANKCMPDLTGVKTVCSSSLQQSAAGKARYFITMTGLFIPPSLSQGQKETDAGACGTDHVGQHFLTDLRNDRLRLALFPKVGQQQEDLPNPRCL